MLQHVDQDNGVAARIIHGGDMGLERGGIDGRARIIGEACLQNGRQIGRWLNHVQSIDVGPEQTGKGADARTDLDGVAAQIWPEGFDDPGIVVVETGCCFEITALVDNVRPIPGRRPCRCATHDNASG